MEDRTDANRDELEVRLLALEANRMAIVDARVLTTHGVYVALAANLADEAKLWATVLEARVAAHLLERRGYYVAERGCDEKARYYKERAEETWRVLS